MWTDEEFEIKQAKRMFIWCIMFFCILKLFYFDIYKIRGHSMDPSFDDGDKVIAEKVSYRLDEPAYGDVVIVQLPEVQGNIKLIKRIIAVGGDTLEIKNGTVYRNGKRLEEDYILEPPFSDYAKITIPEGEVFAMGDNRNHSDDSRYFGTFSKEQLKGRVWIYLFYSSKQPIKIY